MRRAAWLVILLLGLLVAASMCGAGRVGYGGGYATGYRGVRGGAYQAGGGPSGHWNGDTLTSVLTMDPALDHDYATYDAAVAAADYVYQLGVDDTTFAYALVDTYHNGASDLAGQSVGLDGRSYWALHPNNDIRLDFKDFGRSLATKWDLADTNLGPRHFLLHFDPKVPRGATVVSATLHMIAVGWYSSTNDTVVATLMDNPADDKWYHQRKVYDGGTYDTSTDRARYMSKASYSYQWYATTNVGHRGYLNGSNSNTPTLPWTPALSARTRYWDWGSVSDWTPLESKTSFTGEFVVDMTDCVQAIANGAVNNGIVIHHNTQDTADRSKIIYQFEPRDGHATGPYRRPWIQIKYLMKRHPDAFPGGADWAFVFVQSDARVVSGDSLTDVMDEFGAKTTFSMSYFYIGNGTYITWPSILGWLDNGHELAYHTYQHNSNVNYAITDTTSAGWTALKNQLKPQPMFDKAVELGRSDLLDNPRFMRTLAPTAGGFDPFALLASRLMGYEGFYGSLSSNVAGDWIAVSTRHDGAAWARAANCDTARSGIYTTKNRYKRPMDMIPLTMHIDPIVGAETNKGITEEQVKYNFRKLVRQVRADGRNVIVLYTHGTKTDASASTKLIDPEELRWLLEVVQEENGASMTAADYIAWIKAGATAVDSPNRAAVPDTFESTAAQRAWFKPDGIDNRWIRGVK